MQKVALFFLAIISFLVPSFSFAELIKDPNTPLPSIITRSEWGADESWMYRSSSVWGDIFTRPVTPPDPTPTRTDILSQELARLDPALQKPARIVRYEGDERLVWSQAYSSEIRNIVIHHTEQDMSDFSDEAAAVRSIYRYHTLNRGWGDIGYHYLIGPSGKIYEGRRGGEGVVGAHVRWNNAGSIGVSLLGSFTHESPSEAQRESLIKLLKSLTKRYGIDPRGSVMTYRECSPKDSCLFRRESTSTLSGHRDIGATSCPGDAFAPELPRIRERVAAETLSETVVSSDSTLGYVKNKPLSYISTRPSAEPYIRVRLSYSGSSAEVSSASGGLIIRSPSRSLIRLKMGESIKISKSSSGYALEYRGVRQVVPSLTLSARILEIDSWDRRPSWDTTGRYRDNLFRGSLVFPVIDSPNLLIVNRLKIEDYIRGIAEYTNESPKEHIRALSIAARSYAWSYLGTDRKYPGMPYDASDDPESFQKYIGYSYELRSKKVQDIVRGTRGIVLVDRETSRPFRSWYSSSAGGQTRSFEQYCQDRGITSCQVNPHLPSVPDPVSQGGLRRGHGVGLTGDGSAYLASIGWSAEEILAYYYRSLNLMDVW